MPSGTIAVKVRLLRERKSMTRNSSSPFCEPKARFDLPTQNWGREPLRKISQRHYGLGLNRVRGIVEAHGGELNAQYDPKVSALTTTVRLPCQANLQKKLETSRHFSPFKQLEPAARA